MFGSTTPFGSSSPGLFGSASAPSTPFSASTATNPFGAAQAANPFASKPFGTTSFGMQTGSSLFGSGTATGVFGTPTPAFGTASAPAFGTASTPSFGSTPSPFGTGSSLFGQKPASPFGSFGASPGQANPFGSPSFGQTQAAFGAQPFASTPVFGATSTPAFGSTTSAFGAASTPAFGATATPAFGSTSPAFGTTSIFGQSTPAFGASTTPAFGTTSLFGSATASPFGSQTATSFGAPTTPTFGNSPFATSPFTGQRGGTRSTPYAVTNDADTAAGGQAGKLMSITAMPAYKNKSVEELRYEDYQAGDKGGPSTSLQTGGGSIFGQSPSPSPFAASTGFGQTSTPNPFAASSSIFTPKPATGFGALSAPAFGSTATTAFGSSFGSTPSIFGTSTTPAFGTGTAPLFGSPAPFGASSTPGFGSSPFGSSGTGVPVFGSSTPAFGSSSSFSSSSAFNVSSSPFGTSGFFGSTQSSGPFSTPFSQPFGTSTPAFGASTTPAFGGNLFGSSASPSMFLSKPVGSSQSMPNLFGNFQSSTVGQMPGTFSFPSFGQVQPGSNPLSSPVPAFGQFGQQPVQNPIQPTSISISNPFGALPAMPQMSIGRTAGAGPSVQYGISTLPVSEKPTQVRLTSLLTPRHITPRSKIRMHARRYRPKTDGPKVPFFSDDEEALLTPKADLMFIPRENPRALFIKQASRPGSPGIVSASTADAREFGSPVLQDGVVVQDTHILANGSTPPRGHATHSESWQNDVDVQGSPPATVKPSQAAESPINKQSPKQNGARDEQNHKRNGCISMTAHRAGEAAIAYEHGADIEALMPKLHHPDYYTEPRIQELAAKERAMPGYCRKVPDFVVGRREYGHVKFFGETDVRRLNLESIIQFNKCEVLVYMDESKKPPVGQGLNKPAEVTLLNVKCVDKKTGKHFCEGPEVEKYQRRLKKKTEEQGAEFISYNAVKGEWIFKVKHFSRYGLHDFGEDFGTSLILVEIDLMEGIEEGAQSDRRIHFEPDCMRTPILRGSDDYVGIHEDEDTPHGRRVHQAASSHSLPGKLWLDPVKLETRTFIYTLDEETKGVIFPDGCNKFGDGNMPTKIKIKRRATSSSIHGSKHKRSCWRRFPTKQIRKSPQEAPLLPLTNGCSVYGHLESGSVSDYSALHFCSCNGVTTASQCDKRFRVKEKGGERLLCPSSTDQFTDAAPFLGSFLRVGCVPLGLFVHSGTPVGQQSLDASLSSLFHVERVSFDQTVRGQHGTVIKDLTELQSVFSLILHLLITETVAILEKNQDTNLMLQSAGCNPMEVPRFCDGYEDSIEGQHMTKGLSVYDRLLLQHQVMASQLLAFLFLKRNPSPDFDEYDKEAFEKKHHRKIGVDHVTNIVIGRPEFNNWLRDSVRHLVQQEMFNSPGRYLLKDIFSFLTRSQSANAVEKSIVCGHLQMACVLIQTSRCVSSRQDLALQADVWISESGGHLLIEAMKLCIFSLLSGDLLGALNDHSVDWKRFFTMLMRYQPQADTGVPEILKEYCDFLNPNEKPVPVLLYVEERADRPTSETSHKAHDVCVYLTLLHATQSQELAQSKLFSSKCNTLDLLDPCFAWHRWSELQGMGGLESFELNTLDMGFVAELLSVGLIDCASYGVLHIPPIAEILGLHEKTNKEFVSQYCEVRSMSEKQQRFLEKELKGPSTWLHESLVF